MAIGFQRQPELSVIVPITKMAGRMRELGEWLPHALDLGVQVILVHDEQDELTGQELRNLIKSLQNGNLNFIEDSFGSPGAARNAGKELAAGKWITFWDSDDSPSPENYIDAIANTDYKQFQVIIGGFVVINHKNQELIRVSVPPSHKNDQSKYFAQDPGIWRCIFYADLLDNIFFDNSRMGEDIKFLSEMSEKDSNFKFHKDIFYVYHMNFDGQLTQDVNFCSELSKVLPSLAESMSTSNQNQEFRTIIYVKSLLALIRRSNHVGKIKYISIYFINLLINYRNAGRIIYSTINLLSSEVNQAAKNFLSISTKK